MNKPFKIYYQYETGNVMETQFCCKLMKGYWNMGIIFFEPEDLQVINKEGVIFKGCPNCRRKIIKYLFL